MFNTINWRPAQQAIINDNGGMHNILDLTPMNDGICSFIRVVTPSITVPISTKLNHVPHILTS